MLRPCPQLPAKTAVACSSPAQQYCTKRHPLHTPAASWLPPWTKGLLVQLLQPEDMTLRLLPPLQGTQ
jgi:hypothetical protein